MGAGGKGIVNYHHRAASAGKPSEFLSGDPYLSLKTSGGAAARDNLEKITGIHGVGQKNDMHVSGRGGDIFYPEQIPYIRTPEKVIAASDSSFSRANDTEFSGGAGWKIGGSGAATDSEHGGDAPVSSCSGGRGFTYKNKARRAGNGGSGYVRLSWPVISHAAYDERSDALQKILLDRIDRIPSEILKGYVLNQMITQIVKEEIEKKNKIE